MQPLTKLVKFNRRSCSFRTTKPGFMDQRIINLYDEYTHKPLNRQEFIKKLTILAGGTAAAMALLPLLENNYAAAAQTREEDLFTERIKYPGAAGDIDRHQVL